MRSGESSVLARSVWAVSIAAVIGALLIAAARGEALWWIVSNVPPLVGCATVGLVVCLKAPGNRIGWLFLGIAAALGVGSAADVYSAPPALPGAAAAAVVANALSGLPLALLPILVVLFPGGRLYSQRWRAATFAWAAGMVGIVAGFLLGAGPMGLNSDPSLANPIGIAGPVGSIADAAGLMGLIADFTVMAAAAVALVVRFRRASGDERQQLKWFGSAAASVALVAAVSPILWSAHAPWSTYVVSTAWALAGTTLVVATGIAILRFGLYRIDVIIRKTLVYTALLAVLAVAYLGGIFAIDAALREATGQSGALAVTLSTLAVAAMFQPLRTRIQAAVDRRFYRGNYDAARILDVFSGRLREQIDLDALNREILAVLGATVQPSQAGLWIRGIDKSSTSS